MIDIFFYNRIWFDLSSFFHQATMGAMIGLSWELPQACNVTRVILYHWDADRRGRAVDHFQLSLLIITHDK